MPREITTGRGDLLLRPVFFRVLTFSSSLHTVWWTAAELLLPLALTGRKCDGKDVRQTLDEQSHIR